MTPSANLQLLIEKVSDPTLEWLVTNGLGGYASTSIDGRLTRKYHGLLLAALPPPFGRTVVLNQLIEEVTLPGQKSVPLTLEEKEELASSPQPFSYLKEFWLENGLPVWIFQIKETIIEKRVLFAHLQNSLYLSYKLLTPCAGVNLTLTPLIHFRSHEESVNKKHPSYSIYKRPGKGVEIIAHPFPSLKLKMAKEATFYEKILFKDCFYQLEKERGYDSFGKLWSPGSFQQLLLPDQTVQFTASTESWQSLANTSFKKVKAEELRKKQLLSLPLQDAFTQQLVLAADQFIVTPAYRSLSLDKKKENLQTVIAGYPWFTDWGRDTMISLEGLTLCTNRFKQARQILCTFHAAIWQGLIPNMFPESQQKGVYHTADATLWFFHALDRYLEVSRDFTLLKEMLPNLKQVIDWHRKGTAFGIKVDQDGLLMQGAEHYQLTWMDAKVDGWVVTPRRGKAVEINGLWYNALCLISDWIAMEESEKAAIPYKEAARYAYETFNQRFYYPQGGYLYDLIDGEKQEAIACRPNQLFSFSLKHAILDPKYWQTILEVVQKKLLTPLGLRSLAPFDPLYHANYQGSLKERDSAYHQGTVWGWLIGPFIDCWLKVYPDKKQEALLFLLPFKEELKRFGVGSIGEIFDGSFPHQSRGCTAQAWSVAEVLRCLLKLKIKS